MTAKRAAVPEFWALLRRRRRQEVRAMRAMVRHQPPATRWPVYRHPPCFDDLEEWLAWRALAIESGADPGLPCVDCTPAYQAEMTAVGRCGNPQLAVHG